MTIICIECSGSTRDNGYIDRLPVEECPTCHKIAPLHDSYRKSPGEIYDSIGNKLEVGDTIAYALASGRSAGRLVVGKIYKINMPKKTVHVEYETIDWNYPEPKHLRKLTRSWFNYGPEKCLKINTSIV